ncbi:hypothetical protein POM88_019777 [Heracleum sosnowskyi]|uniref:Uncharacterized protein n=1 Tax=Heracleum sosnowskyi TaxID=360622 RepID=A0AAD8IA59_9APIA|nr:hypothetical protein POM88_019777 [Heracleum sosnowskyi]
MDTNAKKASNIRLGDTARTRLKQFFLMDRIKKKDFQVIVEHLTIAEVEPISGAWSFAFPLIITSILLGVCSHSCSLPLIARFASVFNGLIKSGRKQLPKLVVGLLLAGSGVTFYATCTEKVSQIFQQPDIITASMDEVSSNSKPVFRQLRKLPEKLKILMDKIPHQEINEEEASLFDMLWLLLASVIFVPLFQKIPGGSPVLGYLTAGILIGPYGCSIIRNELSKVYVELGSLNNSRRELFAAEMHLKNTIKQVSNRFREEKISLEDYVSH